MSSSESVRFPDPVVIKMNGRRNEGVILKPSSPASVAALHR